MSRKLKATNVFLKKKKKKKWDSLYTRLKIHYETWSYKKKKHKKRKAYRKFI